MLLSGLCYGCLFKHLHFKTAVSVVGRHLILMMVVT